MTTRSENRPHPVAILSAAAGVALCIALALIFFYAPIEQTMGIVQKIFYMHVSAAIVAYAGFFLCSAASVVYLLKRSIKADIVARAGAELGVMFCTFVLVSGPLWARKAWGVWWTGEPRLLLTLVLLLIFVAYLLVRDLGGRTELTRRICAVLAILGAVDIPLVRTSVRRWRGNHPKVVTEGGGGLQSVEMQIAFIVSLVALGLVFAALLWLRIRQGMAEEEVEALHRRANEVADRADELQTARRTS